MQITFTSTLTSEDENRVAPVILKALSSVLELAPIAYAVRIETIDSKVYGITGPANLPNQNNLQIVSREAKVKP